MNNYTIRVVHRDDELAVIVKDAELPRKGDMLTIPLDDGAIVCEVFSVRRRLSFDHKLSTERQIAVYKEANVSVNCSVVEERPLQIVEGDAVEVARDLPEFRLQKGDRGVVRRSRRRRSRLSGRRQDALHSAT